jgi:gas vesicle protein
MYYGSKRTSGSTAGFTIGMMVGALLGAGAALLLAPASGEDTRRVLRKKARRLSQRGNVSLGHVADDAERAARDFARRGRKYAMRARERAMDTAAGLLDDR